VTFLFPVIHGKYLEEDMYQSLPDQVEPFMDWSWEKIEPYYKELSERSLQNGEIAGWLADWTRLIDLIEERFARLYVALTLNTGDALAEERYHHFLDTVHPQAQAANQQLREKLLASGLEPPGLEVPLLRMRSEVDLFREKNLPLLSQERKFASQYDKIVGAQSVPWEGKEITLQQMRVVLGSEDRSLRERAWRLAAARQLDDREAINRLWVKFMELRRQLAENAGLPDYRAYRWKQMLRLDYTPEDSRQFQQAVEEAVVPAATRVYEKHRRRLGTDRLRPWDLDLDLYPIHRPGLPSYGSVESLEDTAERIFDRVDPAFGAYFRTLRDERLLDLPNRPGKAPGAYCQGFRAAKRPFIFMNAVGLSGDVRTLLHESGHAFHVFETSKLPYAQQRDAGREFNEVASMAQELLASPYLSKDQGGFYSPEDAAHFRVEHLEHILTFWPYMAVVDSFQHWVYQNHEQASDPDRCDAAWLELWRRFLPGVDWSGLEEEAMTGWHRKLHIHRYPFYYLEYGVAQLGAVQIWKNALEDQAGAVARYRKALSLGGTARLPELYRTAGAKFAFDSETLGEAANLVEEMIELLDD
jgi:oligoendopeptidase F